MVRVLVETCVARGSADEHLILSVDLINGLRRGRHENFEAAAEARHNRRQLSRRLDHFRLNEVGSRSDLLVRAVDRAANELHFVARLARAVD